MEYTISFIIFLFYYGGGHDLDRPSVGAFAVLAALAGVVHREYFIVQVLDVDLGGLALEEGLARLGLLGQPDSLEVGVGQVEVAVLLLDFADEEVDDGEDVGVVVLGKVEGDVVRGVFALVPEFGADDPGLGAELEPFLLGLGDVPPELDFEYFSLLGGGHVGEFRADVGGHAEVCDEELEVPEEDG